jgi:hypothetical protein
MPFIYIKVSHLSLLNLPWFSFENVHVFAEDKITRKSIVYLTVHLYFYSWAMV